MPKKISNLDYEFINIKEFLEQYKKVDFRKKRQLYIRIDSNFDNLIDFYKNSKLDYGTKASDLQLCSAILRYYKKQDTEVKNLQNYYEGLRILRRQDNIESISVNLKNTQQTIDKLKNDFESFSLNNRIILYSLLNNYTLRCSIASVKFRNYCKITENYIDFEQKKIIYNNSKQDFGDLNNRNIDDFFIELVKEQVYNENYSQDFICWLSCKKQDVDSRLNNFSWYVKKTFAVNCCYSGFRVAIEKQELENCNSNEEKVETILKNNHSVAVHKLKYQVEDVSILEKFKNANLELYIKFLESYFKD